MDDTLIAEIEDIQARLDEIAAERQGLAKDAISRHEVLLDEENQLEASLTELKDKVAMTESGDAEETAAEQTDLTHSPNLPDDPDNQ